ncbi:TIM barrel protein [Liquorilactobacillus capillatus]|uniref:Xylose isomerase domain protein TIM n=1 Tax=Liquorilactobacillus capillatus DSM 19910 TaxID=1423731 RepID=A0A0R1MCN6_9LACO|nr:TIM barrel protein [Liquorilactobacillus capillatus]KRL01176.1 xylose isomerase domain protein TIM [Liquorilactobacillus capillatus DSM 19910]
MTKSIKKPVLGLKAGSDPKQVKDRLQYSPVVFEFFTNEADFTSEGIKRLEYDLQWVKAEATNKIILHHPMRFRGEFTELVAPEKKFPELRKFIYQSTEKLLQLAFDNNVQVLVHGSYARHTQFFIDMYPSLAAARQAVYLQLDKLAEWGKDHIMFENSISPIFYYGEREEENTIIARKYRLAFDTSHCFIKCAGDNKILQQSLRHLKEQIVHYHLVDSMGENKHDSLTLGQGKIDWKEVLPLLNPQATSIYEINLRNQEDAKEQVESHRYLTDLYTSLYS